MKIKLFVLTALVLLSSINGIFFNNPLGISAQEYENVDDYSTAGINEMVEDYISNDDPSKYIADDRYNNYEPDMNQENYEYSTYNSHEPTYNGNEEAEYSSYDNYEYSSDNNEYSQDDYSTYNPSSYEDEYSDNSYGDNYYPPKEPKKFTCADSGIVVDKEENCPLVCPAGTDLEGHLVAAGSNLQVVCDEDAQFDTCGAGTDLEGVLVANAPEDCNINFATCDANDPLGQSLGLTGAKTIEVADPQLCELNVPDLPDIVECPTAPTTEVPNLNPELAGASVTDIALCSVATPAVQCAADTTLDGVWVHPDQAATVCDITIPELATCDETTPLGQVLELGPDETVQVADEQLCNLPKQCGTDTNMAGAFVLDLALCEAPDNDNICPANTDLEGVYVNNPPDDCDIDIVIPDQPIVTNPQAQCLKCADLATFFGGNSAGAQQTLATALIGSTTTNIFTVCESETDPRPGFYGLAPGGCNAVDPCPRPAPPNPAINPTAAETAFDNCLDNAAVEPGTSSFSGFQAQSMALQENSFTTNVRPESGISTFSAPSTIGQGTGDLTAAEKVAKLKQQWRELTP